MGNLVRTGTREGVTIIMIDNPPVNALGPGAPEAIEEAVTRGVPDEAVKAVVLIGAGSTFVARANIWIFETITTREQSHQWSRVIHARLQGIEDSPKLIVVAIHGYALGGGLELAADLRCILHESSRGAVAKFNLEITLTLDDRRETGVGHGDIVPRFPGDDAAGKVG